MVARWAIAVRVSTEEQEVEQQEQALRAAASRHGATVACVVRIEGVSAYDKKASREVERLMLAPIEDGRADTLAVWAFDRMTRQSIKEALGFLERLEKHLGGQLFSLTEPFLSTATMNPEVRDLLASFTAWMANRESARKSERVRAKRDAKVNRAAAIGQNATWGVGVLATPGQVEGIWSARDAGQSVRGIAAAVGVSKSQVSRVLARARPTIPGVPMDQAGQSEGVRVAVAPSLGGGLGQAAGAAGSVPVVPLASVGQSAGVQPLERVETASDLESTKGQGAV